MATAIQKIKSISFSINSSKVIQFGFSGGQKGLIIALTKKGIKKENKTVRKNIFLK